MDVNTEQLTTGHGSQYFRDKFREDIEQKYKIQISDKLVSDFINNIILDNSSIENNANNQQEINVASTKKYNLFLEDCQLVCKSETDDIEIIDIVSRQMRISLLNKTSHHIETNSVKNEDDKSDIGVTLNSTKELELQQVKNKYCVENEKKLIQLFKDIGYISPALEERNEILEQLYNAQENGKEKKLMMLLKKLVELLTEKNYQLNQYDLAIILKTLSVINEEQKQNDFLTAISDEINKLNEINKNKTNNIKEIETPKTHGIIICCIVFFSPTIIVSIVLYLILSSLKEEQNNKIKKIEDQAESDIKTGKENLVLNSKNRCEITNNDDIDYINKIKEKIKATNQNKQISGAGQNQIILEGEEKYVIETSGNKLSRKAVKHLVQYIKETGRTQKLQEELQNCELLEFKFFDFNQHFIDNYPLNPVIKI